MEISCELLCYVLFKKVAIEPTQRYRAVLVVMDLCVCDGELVVAMHRRACFWCCADWKTVLVFMQVILLSATMPSDVLEVTHRFMREPVRILVKKEELTLEGIRQFYVQVEREVCFHPLNLFNSDAIIQM